MIGATPEEKLLNLIRKDQSKAKMGKDLNIFTKINILLIVFILLIAVIFLADIFIFKEKSSMEPVIINDKISQAQTAAVEETEEDDATDQAILDKNISAKDIPREEILKNLNLLGIITGDNNQAIIEDKTLKKTFFLYKGDSLGDLTIYDIKDSVVILEYKGEKVELKI